MAPQARDGEEAIFFFFFFLHTHSKMGEAHPPSREGSGVGRSAREAGGRLVARKVQARDPFARWAGAFADGRGTDEVLAELRGEQES